MNISRKLILIISLLLILCLAAFFQAADTQTVTISNGSGTRTPAASEEIDAALIEEDESASPTQTPNIVYVVVTATPEPEVEGMIQRTTEESVSLKNESSLTADEMVQRVVSTLTAQNNSAVSISNTSDTSVSQCVVQQDDGSTCTMSLELVSEPTYGSGAKVGTDEVFWKEWIVRNTGTCTWTPEYTFNFTDGWQIGNTYFSMNKTTLPGETLNVRLGMTASLPAGKTYYSTYTLTSPSGVQCGSITSTFTVEGWEYFEPTPEPARWMRPQHGRPGGPDYCGSGCGPGPGGPGGPGGPPPRP